MRVFCLGDSLTTGFGVRSAESWLSMTRERTGFDLINGGVNGDSSWGMNYRFRRDVLSNPPDLLFLMGGGNDVLHDGTDRMARRNFAEIATLCAESHLPLMIGLPCPFVPELARKLWSPDIDYDEAQGALSDLIAWFRQQAPLWGAALCDFWSIFAHMPYQQRKSMYIDGLHPRPEGHRLMALTAAAALGAFAAAEHFIEEDAP